MTPEKAQEIFQLLKKHYPNAHMVLNWGNNFELLVAIIVSAQCTDKKVNEVTSTVFPKYRKERKELKSRYEECRKILRQAQNPMLTNEEVVEIVNFAFVPLTELEQDIKSTGFYHNKAKSVQAAAKVVLDKFHGILPKTIAEMTTIPGVGRKTANVFLGNVYHISEGIAVDAHVTRQAQALGLTKNTDPVKIEQDLMKLFPKNQWFPLTYLLIEHGRNMRRKLSDRFMCADSTCILCSQK